MAEDPDIFAYKKQKLIRPTSDNLREMKGYFSYFMSSEIKRVTAEWQYTQNQTKKVEYGMGIKSLTKKVAY